VVIRQLNAFRAAVVCMGMGSDHGHRRRTGIAVGALRGATVISALALGMIVACQGGPALTAAPASAPPAAAAPTKTTQPEADFATAPAIVTTLPALPLPGPRGGPAGDYGWDGEPHSPKSGLHRVGSNGEATALLFAVGPDCLKRSSDQRAVQRRVAGFDAEIVEPFKPPVAFNGVGDEITRAYALAVGDRTLCVYVTWHLTTTEADRDAALHVVDTIRAVPMYKDWVRVNFTLGRGWDTG
jgi:hypothetical protein